jgi:hypothetical protein
MFKKSLLAGLLLSASCVSHAGLITQDVSFGVQGSPSNVDEVSPLTQVLSIDPFDTALGVLNSVSINVFGQVDSEGSSTNLSQPDEPGRSEVDIFLTQDWVVSSAVADDFIFESASFDPLVSVQSSPSGFTMIPNTDSATFNFDVTTGEQSGFLANLDLDAFLGTAPIEFTFSTDAQTIIRNVVDGGTGSFLTSFSTGSWGRIVAEYNFTASSPAEVSAPASVSLAALVVGLVGYARRRRADKDKA